MTEEERNKVLKEKRERLKAMENVKLNHPGGREQFEEVWDKTDHVNYYLVFLIFFLIFYLVK